MFGERKCSSLEALYLDVSIDAPEGRVDKEPGKGKGEQCGTEGHEEAALPDGQHICVRTRKVQIFRNFLQHHVLANVLLKRKKRIQYSGEWALILTTESQPICIGH